MEEKLRCMGFLNTYVLNFGSIKIYQFIGYVSPKVSRFMFTDLFYDASFGNKAPFYKLDEKSSPGVRNLF